MFDKTLLSFLTLAILIIFQLSGVCFADVNDTGFKQQRNLIITNVNSGNFAEAQASLDKLIADFSGHRLLPKSLQNIGRRYEIVRRYAEAMEVYEKIIKLAPNSSYAQEAQFDILRTNILNLLESGNIKEAERAIDNLVNDFSRCSDVPNVLCAIANLFSDVYKYDQAKAVNNRIILHYPNSNYAFKAQINLALTAIRFRRWDDSQLAVRELVTNYAQAQDIGKKLYSIARKYDLAKQYQLAKSTYQAIIDIDPNSSYSQGARFDVSRTNILHLLESGKIIEASSALDGFITDFSNRSDLAKVLSNIARLYERSKRYKEAECVFQKIVSNYPGTDNAFKAQRGIVLLAVNSGKTANVDTAVNKLIADYSGHTELSKTLYSIARRCEIVKNYPQAKSTYQKIIQLDPNSSLAGKAQLDISRTDVLNLINSAKIKEAQTALDRLISDFNDNPDLPVILQDIAGIYANLNEYMKARDSYRKAAEHDSDGNYSKSARLRYQMMGVISFIDSGDIAKAKTEVNDLISGFNNNTGLTSALLEIASTYEKADQYQEAKNIYHKIMVQDQNNLTTAQARLYIARTNIISLVNSENKSNIDSVIDKMIADFKGHPELAKAVFLVGEEYYEKAFSEENQGNSSRAGSYFNKAISIWEKIIREFPQCYIHQPACYFSGMCYSRINQHEKAIESFSKVVENWPDYEYAWSALFMTGRSYESLGKTGAISKAQAEEKIKTTYQQLIYSYPDCLAAEYAGHWLSSHN